MFALHSYRAGVHEACGTYLPDSTEDEDGWEPELPIRCHVCTVRSIAYRQFEDGGGRQPEAMLWPVKKKR